MFNKFKLSEYDYSLNISLIFRKIFSSLENNTSYVTRICKIDGFIFLNTSFVILDLV